MATEAKGKKKEAGILSEIWQNRQIIRRLAVNDFRTRYAGSYLGIIWAFVQPCITILLYWFVFEKGLRAGRQAVGNGEVPFLLFLISGLVPWFFFADALPNGTGSLISYDYLVKKVVFKVSILPVVRIIASIFVHLFFIVVAVVIFWAYGYPPDACTLQVFYYSFGTMLLALGLSYMTSAAVVFFRDLKEIVGIVLQIMVWATPIMWNLETTVKSGALRVVFKLNPMYYVVSGYRDALINKKWFWENPVWTLWFWGVTAAVLVLGGFIFRRLMKHFADVL